MKCLKCNGTGLSGDYIVNDKITYQIVCSKCLGKRYIDWIENIVGIKTNVFIVLDFLETNLKPDNYTFSCNGSKYYVKKPYFLIKDDDHKKWQNVGISVDIRGH